MSKTAKAPEDRIVTIPNILSFLRILMIPIFVWSYVKKQDMWLTAGILALSGLTDTVDGFIARHFNMVTNLGKALDPVADKLTQAAMLFCLITRFHNMLLLFLLLAVKEIGGGIMGLLILRRTGKVYPAEWHGKLTTALLYATMIVHVLWFDIPQSVSNEMILVCTMVMIMSLILYAIRNINALNTAKAEPEAVQK